MSMQARPARKKDLQGLRLKLAFGIAGGLVRLGLAQTADAFAAQPIAKRKANKSPWWATLPLPPDVAMRLDQIQGRSGSIAIKTYRPATLDPNVPRVLFLHGGGWIGGGLDTLDHLCASVSASARCEVFSVDYRLAPEAPFPGALEDCQDALNWLAAQKPAAAGIAVMGESAGGNLAAALCVLNARCKGPAVRHQTLIYPCVDATLASPSMADGPPGFEKKDIARLVELYRGSAALTDPLLSPLFAENHAELPPALIITADLDPARDDGTRYARKLADAGVRVRHINYERAPHGFFVVPRLCGAAKKGVADISAELVALSRTPA